LRSATQPQLCVVGEHSKAESLCVTTDNQGTTEPVVSLVI